LQITTDKMITDGSKSGIVTPTRTWIVTAGEPQWRMR